MIIAHFMIPNRFSVYFHHKIGSNLPLYIYVVIRNNFLIFNIQIFDCKCHIQYLFISIATPIPGKPC